MRLQPASLQLSPEGIPFSPEYGDVYHAAAGALAQARHVFLTGNGLPERWQGREGFVIVETGFGLGHNFLTAWQAWREDPLACGTLHFLSVEKHPFSASDLAAAHQAADAPAELSAELIRHWPVLLPGCHRISLDGGRVILDLFLGDVENCLADAGARADAIFLDGFSPARNPEMWSDGVFRALAALSDQETTLATWSVSGAVREGLRHAGFAVEKTEGFADKRQMLQGRYRGPRPRGQTTEERHALVIGAGLAGSAVAERLAARGWRITLIEAHEDVAQGASGNLAGAFRPLPSKDDNLLSRVTRAGFLYGLQQLARLEEAGHSVLWEDCGVLHLARSGDQEARQREVISSLGWPQDFLDWVDAAEATRKAGHTAGFGGWWFPRGGWIQPRSLVEAQIAMGGARIQLLTGQPVARLEQRDGVWHALSQDGSSIASAPQVVLANAHDARRLADAQWLPLRAARGQVSHLPMAQLAPLGVVVCGQGYITPGIGLHAALGASFVVDDFDLGLREEEHAENLARLGRMLPGMADRLAGQDIEGRVSLRPVSPDRLPMVGAMPAIAQGEGFNLSSLPRTQGLWIITGFGARGLVWSNLCGELLAARLCNEPLPLERSLAEAMDPARFLFGKTPTLAEEA
ncbi:MAG: bifunctional tRNA (5-methylaminomethyl-2-thiouridine)(34)-methyltransferase MnmD/FAD-dependent 5-carboxymethylaminomethyl-2-thiouridine(34) oxidoreductase MnmC [Candidatus Dactylopiibacterium carminicum]|uniref:tRNA 5-methylaminomethyl-2-thiouridine biosynthesis bifunctional protein MnmC n=1 Tax=Candidatus Dactylopiibacterium carminicum TaxID=857335 RepID=A0A272ERB0_9RHOO|nr:bifunctional tRNA (5-methylaminomethyl-2-thiouridine)(34)-methyltransferase MnmD/FAD-dependent 5-carboxymethylaminomethyl-2-thiouridine(34) oxidoreductase MnmC [Candidatus Dactylopiibacterium carminicum]PAS92614.1 MAG: bifunctional tRNA (5-methylaminomethyl-2-thiouridine)(34)-methyltransferase MnmD/FAD-dependent 5-carboxymethylaminomethyl-2-thiouridine(34) oxidoreductase MnmC [Candidatus Dactylopiibacterium carminicum]PAS93911.1 MAG: bifunctional tRNA (5-methylaminomethyl-2-thiouridine)(34)-me